MQASCVFDAPGPAMFNARQCAGQFQRAVLRRPELQPPVGAKYACSDVGSAQNLFGLFWSATASAETEEDRKAVEG